MQAREFLNLARDLAQGKGEVHWRAAAVHAYYALMLECREAQARWGLPPPPRHNVHAAVRLRFVYATEPDLKTIGDALDQLSRWRNQASYDLTSSSVYSSSAHAQQAVQRAANALALLDAIDNDPQRRAAAIASIQP